MPEYYICADYKGERVKYISESIEAFVAFMKIRGHSEDLGGTFYYVVTPNAVRWFGLPEDFFKMARTVDGFYRGNREDKDDVVARLRAAHSEWKAKQQD